MSKLARQVPELRLIANHLGIAQQCFNLLMPIRQVLKLGE
jgi:hypothetical protein